MYEVKYNIYCGNHEDNYELKETKDENFYECEKCGNKIYISVKKVPESLKKREKFGSIVIGFKCGCGGKYECHESDDYYGFRHYNCCECGNKISTHVTFWSPV